MTMAIMDSSATNMFMNPIPDPWRPLRLLWTTDTMDRIVHELAKNLVLLHA